METLKNLSEFIISHKEKAVYLLILAALIFIVGYTIVEQPCGEFSDYSKSEVNVIFVGAFVILFLTFFFLYPLMYKKLTKGIVVLKPNDELIPEKYKGNLEEQIKEQVICVNENSITLEKVSRETYSEYASSCCLDTSEIEEIFTVFSIEPHVIISELFADLKKHNTDKEILEITKNETKFLKAADYYFKHFKSFREFYNNNKDNTRKVTRIVIIKDDKWFERNDLNVLKYLLWLNGEIPIYYIHEETLKKRDVFNISDYVIWDSHCIVDYFEEARKLVITNLENTREFNYFMKLKDIINELKDQDATNDLKKYFEFEINKSKSHLYMGYQYVSLLPSIIEQRKLEVELIKKYIGNYKDNSILLSAGIAWGKELEYFESNGLFDLFYEIIGIDIKNEVKEVIEVNLNQKLTADHNFHFQNLDLLNLDSKFEKNYFDCIQCGFVLEDVKYEFKEDTYRMLYKCLKHGGLLLISEMYLDNKKQITKREEKLRKKEIISLYDGYIKEANDNISNPKQRNQLIGNGTNEGLLKTKLDALNCSRDYFQTKEEITNLLKKVGFKDIEFVCNKKSHYLGIITAKKV